MILKSNSRYPDPDYRSAITAKVADILDRGAEVEGFETSIRTEAGEQKIIAWNSRRFFDGRGDIVGSIAIGRDITARKRAEDALMERERQLATLMANLPGLAYRCLNDERWTMKFVSSGCSRLTGYEPAALMDNRELSYAAIIHEDDRARVMEEVQQALAENRHFAAEYRVRRQDGGEIWVWEQGQPVIVDGEMFLEGIIIDISRRKAMEEELERLATRDPLTSLYNRRELEHQLREELARAQRYDRPLCLLWIDVDHFKSINDRFGHQAGDEVLRRLSRLLESSIRTSDYVARYGGEELAVVLPEMHEGDAMEMAERVRRVVETTHMVTSNSRTVTISISVGVAAFPTHGTTPEQLFKAADQAMYEAKQRGRNQVCRAA